MSPAASYRQGVHRTLEAINKHEGFILIQKRAASDQLMHRLQA